MAWITLESYFKGPNLGLLPLQYNSLVETALQEDLGRGGDITTNLIFDSLHESKAVIKARDSGVISGLAPALWAWKLLDSDLQIKLFKTDGDSLESGETILKVKGSTRALLTGERTVLNFLGHLSGISTRTAKLSKLIQGSTARICDTRKTIPGLRSLQKYAVRCGGGFNHRLGLDDCVLIKDNHIAACGSITAAVQKVRLFLGHTVKIEVEIDNLIQLGEALDLSVEIVMLDNFTASDIALALKKRNDFNGIKPLFETSGRVDETTIQALAQTGIDLISVGALTHSVKNFDFGLDYL